HLLRRAYGVDDIILADLSLLFFFFFVLRLRLRGARRLRLRRGLSVLLPIASVLADELLESPDRDGEHADEGDHCCAQFNPSLRLVYVVRPTGLPCRDEIL